MHVAVIYATKYGSTAEIAEAIARTLRDAGVEAAAADAEQVGDLPHASALVIGSAVYAGQWRKPARTFVEAYGPELRTRAVWLFSSGPIGDTGPDGNPVDLDELLELTGAREHKVFAGRLDPNRLNVAERLMVRALKAPTGDFRDWDEIKAWAKSIVAAL